MELTDYIKRLIRNFLMIFASIIICITILRQIFAPDEYFKLKDIFIYMICALAADFPGLIFYSPKEISESEMRLRIIIHFLVLESVIVTLTNITGWVTGIIKTTILTFQIAVIYALLRFLKWKDDTKAASKINEKLKSMKDESSTEPE